MVDALLETFQKNCIESRLIKTQLEDGTVELTYNKMKYLVKDDIVSKLCRKCSEYKNIDDFNSNGNKKRYVCIYAKEYTCRECVNKSKQSKRAIYLENKKQSLIARGLTSQNKPKKIKEPKVIVPKEKRKRGRKPLTEEQKALSKTKKYYVNMKTYKNDLNNLIVENNLLKEKISELEKVLEKFQNATLVENVDLGNLLNTTIEDIEVTQSGISCSNLAMTHPVGYQVQQNDDNNLNEKRETSLKLSLKPERKKRQKKVKVECSDNP